MKKLTHEFLNFFQNKIIYQFLEIVYPRHCIFCKENLHKESKWSYCCLSCWDTLSPIVGPACMQCGQAFEGEVEGVRICPQCLELESQFHEGKSLFTLNDSMREWIHTFKYHRGLYVLKDLENFLLENKDRLNDFFEDAILVPVPIHWRKYLKRGYNQSECIAKSLRMVFPIQKIDPLLIKIHATKPQVELSREDRLKNVNNSFSVKRRKKNLDPNETYILIDDVFTTGSTLKACAKILSKNGAKKIKVFTIARG